jgi:hypothetical protein
MSFQWLAGAGAVGIIAVVGVTSCFDDVRKETTIIIVNGTDAGSDGAVDSSGPPETGGGEEGGADSDDRGGPDAISCPNDPGRFVDLANDPANCGACENRCSFPNGAPLCDMGVCRGGVCDPGFHDVDGSPANGCECTATGDETCDQIDNDCDGIVDGSVVDGIVMYACMCNAPSIIPAGDQALLDTSSGTCGTTFCQRTGGGPFALNYCCDVGMFAQCHIEKVDLNRFDADHEASGVLEVAFCLSAPVTRSMLHLWYGRYPFRKALPLVGTDGLDLVLGPGCYVRYFAPQDALCAAYDPRFPLPVSKPDNIPFPSKCIGPPPNFYTWPCKDGRWTVAGEECRFDYDQTSLWITVENCIGRSESTVSLQSVRLLSADCTCSSDDQCIGTGRPRCAPAHATSPSCPSSNPRCAGLCTDKL